MIKKIENVIRYLSNFVFKKSCIVLKIFSWPIISISDEVFAIIILKLVFNFLYVSDSSWIQLDWKNFKSFFFNCIWDFRFCIYS